MGNPNHSCVESMKQWLRPGLASALVLVAALTGCASNSGNPVIQNASWNSSGGSDSDGNSTSSSMGSSDSTYQVRSGDTLYSIAWRQKMPYQQLAQLNNIQPPYTLSVGQKLRLNENGTSSAPAPSAETSDGSQTHALGSDSAPVSSSNSDNWLLSSDTGSNANGSSGANGATAAAGGAVAGAAVGATAASSSHSSNSSSSAQGTSSAPTASTSNTAASNTSSAPQTQATAPSNHPQADTNRKYVPATTIHWQWPTNGTIIGQYGNGADVTSGIDIAGQQGQPIYAAGPGLVIYAGNGVRGYGNLIIIRHNDHYLSAYAHNASLLVKEGDVVSAGQKIATMGNTESTNVELHFEIRLDGKPVNPVNYLPKQ